VLVVLDDAPARAEVARAERAVEAAETRVWVARTRAASDGRLLPEVAVAEGEANDARAALTTANARLASTLLLAPFDGVVEAVRVSEGGAYAPNSDALTIADPGDLVVGAEVDEVDRPLLAEGQEATVTVTAFPGTPLTGRVESLSGVAQSRGGTTIYPLTVAFDRPAGLALRPGMSAEVRLVPADQAAALLLPSSAVRRAGERRYVVARRGGQEVEIEVRTGASSGGDVEIAAGLAEGDEVILP
jgi:RND family efflux transporter MFP subunit